MNRCFSGKSGVAEDVSTPALDDLVQLSYTVTVNALLRRY
jgi:hypothetical protein